MTKNEIEIAIQQLPEDLQRKLATLPHGATVADFTDDEKSVLHGEFGEDWPIILGVG